MGKKCEIRITEKDVFHNTHLYPRAQKKGLNFDHRPYVADRFKKEHGCFVTDLKEGHLGAWKQTTNSFSHESQ